MLGTFLEDPVDVPRVVVDYAAGQLGIDDPSCIKQYAERVPTRYEHAWEIRDAYGYRDFAAGRMSCGSSWRPGCGRRWRARGRFSTGRWCG